MNKSFSSEVHLKVVTSDATENNNSYLKRQKDICMEIKVKVNLCHMTAQGKQREKANL